MNVRDMPSPYAMAAALCDGVLDSEGQRLLVELVRNGGTEEAKISAMLLLQQTATVFDLNSFAELHNVLEQDDMNYVFFGVVHDPDYRAIRDQRIEAPAVKPPSTVEYCFTQALDSVRTLWLGRVQMNERVHAAYVSMLNLAVKRHLKHTVQRWAREAKDAQWGQQVHAQQYTLDYGVSRQRGYAKMRTDLHQAGWDVLGDAECRARILEESGFLPESKY